MTRLARRATLPVAICLLTSAATASAEYPWVLWTTYITHKAEVENAITGAFQSQRDCEGALPNQVQSQLHTWRGVYETVTVSPADPAVVVARGLSKQDDGATLIIRVTCWPLGLEPKGRIGGARYREQGAWVTWAWNQALPVGRIWWSITPNAFETKSECEADAKRREAEYKNKVDRTIDRTLICFPAGTDPREPTERGR